MADKVPSPMWNALNNLLTDVQKNVGTVGGALKDADKRMQGGKGDVWVGSTARDWGAQLAGHASDLSRQAGNFLDDVQRELNSTAKEVTPQQAHMENLLLSGRLG